MARLAGLSPTVGDKATTVAVLKVLRVARLASCSAALDLTGKQASSVPGPRILDPTAWSTFLATAAHRPSLRSRLNPLSLAAAVPSSGVFVEATLGAQGADGALP